MFVELCFILKPVPKRFRMRNVEQAIFYMSKTLYHMFSCALDALTLPVRRYLVPTPSTNGGGLSRPPMISKTVDSTTFNIGRPLGLSMRGRNR